MVYAVYFAQFFRGQDTRAWFELIIFVIDNDKYFGFF